METLLEEIRNTVIKSLDIEGNPMATAEGSSYRVYQLSIHDDEVRLSDVLFSIEKCLMKSDMEIASKDRMIEQTIVDIVQSWDLLNDSLKSQSESTLEFIKNLLQ